MTEKEVFDWLSQVEHPGKEDKDIVSLGMVEEVVVAEGKVTVTLAFGKRPDPLKNYLEGAVRAAVYRNAPGGTEDEYSNLHPDSDYAEYLERVFAIKKADSKCNTDYAT